VPLIELMSGGSLDCSDMMEAPRERQQILFDLE
jgi:hypothetical protein